MVRCDGPMSRSGVTVGCEGQVIQLRPMVRRDDPVRVWGVAVRCDGQVWQSDMYSMHVTFTSYAT